MTAQLAAALAAYNESGKQETNKQTENDAATGSRISGGEQVDNGGELLEAQGRFAPGRERIRRRLQCWSRRGC